MAGSANIEMAVNTPLYEGEVHRIRQALKDIFSNTFETKAGYLNPVEWRPREYNSPPDTVCNWVLDQRDDLSNLSLDSAIDAVTAGMPLQIHSDGGFRDGVGAAAFVVHAHESRTGTITRIGYSGSFMCSARSAFHAEGSALLAAVKLGIEDDGKASQ